MKKKMMFWLYQVLFVGLLIAGVMRPESWLMHLPVVSLWLSNAVVWVLAFFGCLAYCAGREARLKMLAALAPFFKSPKQSFLSRAYGWALKVLIVLSLAFTGWLLTLACYVLTVVVYQLCRSALSEPDAT